MRDQSNLVALSARRSSPEGDGVPNRVLIVAMSEVRLQGAGVVAGIGEGEAAGMTQHVRLRLEIESGFHARPLDHLGEAGSREGRAALAHENV
jgi:hypothetical protein